MRIIPTCLFLLLCAVLHGQDTLRIMHYNLLNYGNNYGDCNSSNNNVDDKNEYLKVLVDHLQPDILTVNEISDNSVHHDYLLNNVFNVNGSDAFKRASLPNLANSPIMNQVFYNSQVVELLGVETVETNYRDIDIISFFCTEGNSEDSIVLRCVVAHLKAGSDPGDAQERASETYKLMHYLDVNNFDGNFILSGDLNLYGASESAFQNLLLYADEDVRFYDPLNMIGEWHANSYFAAVHTQSTHTSGDCFAWGGMDDRFDFILASAEVMEGSLGLKFVPGSLAAVGQDGLRLDQSLISPSNNSVPAEVLSALYAMSDHLPLVMDITVDANTGDVTAHGSALQVAFQNPVSGFLRLDVRADGIRQARIQLLDQYGRTQWSNEVNTSVDEEIIIPVSHLTAGIYFITLMSQTEPPVVQKLIISN